MHGTTIRTEPERDDELAMLRARIDQLTAERDAALDQARLDRALLELSPSIMWRARPDGVVTYLSRQFYELTGFDSAEIPPSDWARGLHPDDTADVTSVWERALAEGAAYDTEFRLKTPEDDRWQRARAIPLTAGDGSVFAWLGCTSDIHESKLQSDSLRRLATVVEQSQDFIGYADLAGRVQFVNEAGRALIGLTGDPSATEVTQYFAPEDAPRIAAEILPAVMEHGSWSGDMRFRHFGTGELIPVRYNIFVLYDRSGTAIGYGTVTHDLTAEKKAEAYRDALSRELVHRMKNTLAVVQSIAAQTIRTSSDLTEARRAIASRLAALSRAQDILTDTSWNSAGILSVVEAALEPHRSGQGQFQISGPELELTAQQALGLSLAIHELATNAVKHGALSVTPGRVKLDWSCENGAFAFTWTERGGPAVTAPGRRGFGSRLLEDIVASYFDGHAEMAFERTGIRFALRGALIPGADGATDTDEG